MWRVRSTKHACQVVDCQGMRPQSDFARTSHGNDLERVDPPADSSHASPFPSIEHLFYIQNETPRTAGSTVVRVDVRETFSTYGGCVFRIAVTDNEGDQHSGTGFHIGDGYIVTARHVVEEMRTVTVAGATVSDILYPADESVDLALLATNLRMEPRRVEYATGGHRDFASAIPIGSHLDDWLVDEQFILAKVLVMGYPPIPQSREPVIVGLEAEVAAVIDKYVGTKHPHFVLSSIPRGGFSGGPVMMEDFLLGVVTESLLEGDQPLELGFTAALTVEPLLNLLVEHRIFPYGWNGDWARYLTFESLVADDWYKEAFDYLPTE